MKIRFLRKGIILVLCSILLSSALAFAAEMTMQGGVMGLDLKKNTIIINEETFVWGTNTKFFNEYASPITVDQIEVKNWVYIEGVTRKGKPTAILKIYLLPKYIGQEEIYKYPFMK